MSKVAAQPASSMWPEAEEGKMAAVLISTSMPP
jgi:hypothetical protein